MHSVKPEYGWGPEAVEVGFSYVNGLEKKPQFVLLIGDAPSNETLEVVKMKRNDEKGESYWEKQSGFATPTWWSDELDKLVASEIGVNCFYLKERAKENFTEIADRSKGVVKPLDVSKQEKSVKAMVGAIADQVLEAIAGSELREKYHEVNKDIPCFL